MDCEKESRDSRDEASWCSGRMYIRIEIDATQRWADKGF